MLVALVALTGCATQVTPEMRQKAMERKGQQYKIEVTLTPEDQSRRCGYAKGHEMYACTQNILQHKIEDAARDYCVFYGPYKINWQGTTGLVYNRATKASTTVTCLGTREQAGS